MNGKEHVDRLARPTGLLAEDGTVALDRPQEAIVDAVTEGDRVHVSRFTVDAGMRSERSDDIRARVKK